MDVVDVVDVVLVLFSANGNKDSPSSDSSGNTLDRPISVNTPNRNQKRQKNKERKG